MAEIELYDTTLRDGMQGEGMSLSAHEKLRVAHRLDELGIDLIEAGFPSSNPKELELFELLVSERFQHAEVTAFGMTRRRGTRAEEDPALRVLADCHAPMCTVVGKTWGLHLEKVVRADPQENLRMISESVEFLRRAGKRVIYDAEHFFDGLKRNPDYARGPFRRPLPPGRPGSSCAIPTAAPYPTKSPWPFRKSLARSPFRWESTLTMMVTSPWPMPWRPSGAVPFRCKERLTAWARGVETSTCVAWLAIWH